MHGDDPDLEELIARLGEAASEDISADEPKSENPWDSLDDLRQSLEEAMADYVLNGGYTADQVRAYALTGDDLEL